MISKSAQRPDIRSPACQAALSELVQSLAAHHGGSAFVILTNDDGIALQACVGDAVDMVNMAWATLVYAADAAEKKISGHDCPGCRCALARLTAARDILSDSPAASSGHAPAHRVH